MVNSDLRRKASDLILKYVARQITNDELSDDFPRDQGDPAFEAIWSNLWFYYSDTSHKAEGKQQLSPQEKELFCRCAAFLQTALEYEWPAYEWINFKHLWWRLIGRGGRIDQKFEEFRRHGDFDVWPFIRREDYTLSITGMIPTS